jgi:hypothetical protein
VETINEVLDIQRRIYTIRGVQVMLDSDLAVLYEVETRAINQAVKRNLERFPDLFCFQLTQSEFESLRSQIVTLETELLRSQIVTSKSTSGGRRYLPFVFTEQGVAMLSAVLKSETAVKMSIEIMNAFVNLRRFVSTNAQIFNRLDTLETKQVETDHKLDQVLNALESKVVQPKQGIFFNGQIFDAYQFISDLFRSAEKKIVIIDNFIDDTVLVHLAKRKDSVQVTILTKSIPKLLNLDIKKFNDQYPKIEIKEFAHAHDRFIIIDNLDVYHLGVSLKDLGKKWCAFSKFDKETFKLLEKIEKL